MSDSTQSSTQPLTQQSENELPIEQHPFPPVLPKEATIMMMGSFPPTEDKWAMPFHYPNFYNDMWRIYGEVFFADPDHFRVGEEKRFEPQQIIDFMHERGIASCPTVRSAIREQGNAADKHLQVVDKVDLDSILSQVPQVQTLFTTGGKATEILLSLLENPPKLPKTNQHIDYPYPTRALTLYRLPSTSRAYPLAFAKKVEAYRAFFAKMGKI
ncbi:DNA glycosylase [Psychrobacter sp. I-STPA10]|uniref:DNA glycosylase n=1 Tax=Psychrobacter sp. I-STPA10 TaxID=2585769 RepID=UPI001E58AC9E|nr:DNA glycosylase [Psychrobacter sp. I-STPA10]